MSFKKISHLTSEYFSLHYSHRRRVVIQYVLIIWDTKKSSGFLYLKTVNIIFILSSIFRSIAPYLLSRQDSSYVNVFYRKVHVLPTNQAA